MDICKAPLNANFIFHSVQIWQHTVLPANKPYLPVLPSHRSSPPFAGTHFTVLQRVEDWVDLGGLLHAKLKWCTRESNLDMVTHPSTNRAQRRLTSLIETNSLPVRQTANLEHSIHWHSQYYVTGEGVLSYIVNCPAQD